jgi:hypothetical protein
MTFQVHDGGIWKPVNSFSVKDAGTWKPVQSAYIKDAGAWKEFYTAAVLLNFTVEVWGQGGYVWASNILNFPPVANGGYNKVSVQALSNRIGNFTSRDYGGVKGPNGGSAQFNIDGEWIVVAGGGSEPGSYITWNAPGFSNPTTLSSNPSNPGTGGYNQTSGPSNNQGEVYSDSIPPGGGTAFWWVSGGGGGGAPGGIHYPPSTSINAGQGGQGNIRCYFDSGTTSGNAAGVATMAFVDSATGTGVGSPRMVITNTATGRSRTYTYSGADISFPLSDIINY